jgi:hypothetical protein
MAAQQINKATLKAFSLKRLARKRKKMGGGDAGVLSKRILGQQVKLSA